MMAKEKKRPGIAKLLDMWDPPENSGEPIGCLATSFTFNPVFFEEECLARFLKLESDPSEDGAAYLIEREDKLSQLVCAAALVDQHHCRGSRNLRWDMLPARLSNSLLHAKLCLLCWGQHIRIIVSSANLTEDGYRRNLEVLATLDFSDEGSEVTRPVLFELLDFLNELVSQTFVGAPADHPQLARWQNLLEKCRAISADWKLDNEYDSRTKIRVHPILCTSDRPSALQQIRALWPDNSPPDTADVFSPFFDPAGDRNRPADELWKILKQRGEAILTIYTEAEAIEGQNGYIFHAPESILHSVPGGRSAAEVHFGKIEEGGRPLHGKGVWLNNSRWVAFLIGSSNFTTRGLGLIPAITNAEANILFLVDAEKFPKEYSALQDSFPHHEDLETEEILHWEPSEDLDSQLPPSNLPLPKAFVDALFDLDKKGSGKITLFFAGDPPSGWKLREEAGETMFAMESEWRANGSPQRWQLEWKAKQPPSGFWVTWNDCDGNAWIPVSIVSPASLPPPEELKDLPLDVLIEVLTSSRPLHQVLKAHLAKKKAGDGIVVDGIVDPHKRVDTSRFLLQRTRRVSWALGAMRERLERPAATEESLTWRLDGPVGLRALSDAISKESQSPGEKSFLIAELAMELSHCEPQTAPGCLPAERIRQAVHEAASRLRDEISDDVIHDLANPISEYIHKVFQEISR